jgi:hypothetical protein
VRECRYGEAGEAQILQQRFTGYLAASGRG